jgi:hypothetical protein
MTKGSLLRRNTVEGSVRGIVVKHAYFDDNYVNAIIEYNTIINCSRNHVGAGASAGTGASSELEPDGHERVSGCIVRYNKFITTDTNLGQPAVQLGFHADGWKVHNNVFYSVIGPAGQNITLAGEGTPGFYIGGNHSVYENTIVNANSRANVCITSGVSADIKNNTISGEFSLGISMGTLVSGAVNRKSEISGNLITGALELGTSSGSSALILADEGREGVYISRNTLNITSLVPSASGTRDNIFVIHSKSL